MKNGILEQALQLSEEILSNIELSNAPLSTIMLKASRLARLLDDFEYQKIFQFENSGYPSTHNGLKPEIMDILKKVNRNYVSEDGKERAHIKSIESYEQDIELAKDELSGVNNVLVALSTSNAAPSYRREESNKQLIIKRRLRTATDILSSRKSFIYNFALEKNYELKYSQLNNNIFERTQLKVDGVMMHIIPETIKKFTSVYSNLLSENDEDWSNAVHSCRRILQDLADEIYPAREPKELPSGRKINLGVEQYINRLITYIEEHSESGRFEEIVGSNLSYMGERLDSIFNATQKGSHKVISTQEEADRYVIYTYLLVGDILRLKTDVESMVAVEVSEEKGE
ncbi:MAG: hypothetical protein WBF48_04965 [Halarcobacter sp.]